MSCNKQSVSQALHTEVCIIACLPEFLADQTNQQQLKCSQFKMSLHSDNELLEEALREPSQHGRCHKHMFVATAMTCKKSADAALILLVVDRMASH